MEYEAENPAPALRGYVLCGEPRAGTTYLKDLLTSTGKLGRPREWFALHGTPKYGPRADTVSEILGSASPNGVYGIKMFTFHAKVARRLQWTQRLPNLSFVHIQRQDMLGQAISLARALQTRRFVAEQNEQRQPQYDRRKIDTALLGIARGQARWEIWFARHAINPLRLTYEGIAADPEGTVASIAALVGVEDARIDWDKIPSKVMRDGKNDGWRERYLSEAPSPNIIPSLIDRSPRAALTAIRNLLR